MNTERNEDKQSENNALPIGEKLKLARKKMGLSKQDVADRLKLRISVIQELEDDSDEKKQVATYTRGYIRSYSKLLGLDADELLDCYGTVTPSIDDEQKMQSFSRKTTQEQDDNRVMNLTWIILAVVISLSAFWWWQNQSSSIEDADADAQMALTSEEQTAQAVVNFDEKELEKAEIEETVIIKQDPKARVGTSPSYVNGKEDVSTKVFSSSDRSSERKSNHSNERNVGQLKKNKVVSSLEKKLNIAADRIVEKTQIPLIMSFSEDCWVEVYDAGGKRLATGIKSAGERLIIYGQAPISVVLGVPQATELIYDGKNIDLSHYPRGRVARLSLKP